MLHRAEHKVRPYDLVRIAVALVLLCAAGLKAQSLLSPLAGTEAFSGWERAIGPLAIGVEWLMGIWLLSGIAQAWARRGALALLSLFVTVAGYRLFSGSADCGCFGNVHVYPIWTLTFDIFALVFMYSMGRHDIDRTADSHRRVRSDAWRMMMTAIIAICVPAAAAAAGRVRTPWDAVFLGNPSSWVGKPLPLLPYVNSAASADLSNGQRTVVLFSRECNECRTFLKRLAQQSTAAQANQMRLIDIAPADAPAAFTPPKVFREIMPRQDRLYAVKFPLKVTLRDGIVRFIAEPR